MSVLAPARCVSAAPAPMPSVPGTGHPGPGYDPPEISVQPGARGEVFMVVVADFPSGTPRGPLWGARFKYVRQARGRGPGSMSIEVPLTPANRRVLGEPSGEVDRVGQPLVRYEPWRWEFLVGSTHLGVTDRYVCRGRFGRRGGMLSMELMSIEGLPISDRVIGAATRVNRLGGVGSFENGLAGWRKVGGCQAQIVQGGPSGKQFVRISGDPETSYLEATALLSQPPRTWGRQRVGGTVYARVPTGDWTDYQVLTVGVEAGGEEVWPDPRIVDEGAALFQEDWGRNRWLPDQITAYGYLPTPPYDAKVKLRLHPVSDDPGKYVDYDAPEVVLRENTSTEHPVDRIRHIGELFDHFQNGREKEPWKISVRYGEPVGVAEVKTWWHEDLQSGAEALEGVCGLEPGPDYWAEGPARTVVSAKRRGAKRDDLMIHTWDVLNDPGLDLDVGAMRNALKTTSSAGALWGSANTGAIDLDAIDGQVIDAVIPGPAGMGPNHLDEWTDGKLNQLKLVAETGTLRLPFRILRRINVGDSLRLALVHHGSLFLGWYRVTRWEHDPDHHAGSIDVGTDPDLGHLNG